MLCGRLLRKRSLSLIGTDKNQYEGGPIFTTVDEKNKEILDANIG